MFVALELINIAVAIEDEFDVEIPDREVGNELLTVSGISKTIGDRKVLDNVSFTLRPCEKVAFVGDPVSITTLFKIITGELEPDEGSFKWGVTTSQAYFPADNSAFFDKNRKNWLHILTDDYAENYNRTPVYPEIADQFNERMHEIIDDFNENRRGIIEQ